MDVEAGFKITNENFRANGNRPLPTPQSLPGPRKGLGEGRPTNPDMKLIPKEDKILKGPDNVVA